MLICKNQDEITPGHLSHYANLISCTNSEFTRRFLLIPTEFNRNRYGLERKKHLQHQTVNHRKSSLLECSSSVAAQWNDSKRKIVIVCTALKQIDSRLFCLNLRVLWDGFCLVKTRRQRVHKTKIMKRVRYCEMAQLNACLSALLRHFIVILVYQVACLHSKRITKLMTDKISKSSAQSFLLLCSAIIKEVVSTQLFDSRSVQHDWNFISASS